ncbi:MAG: zf-TFIIB domain-containing protein [Candidatus Gastranaerophilales bacterium]|nr:zf-TFIIB domain-containing protein [Candidatus Gastranaerophilales bacterium]
MADNDKILTCPACGKEMKKIFMSEQNLYLDVCLDGCGGIFFDKGEFKKFDEVTEDITPLLEAIKDKTFKTVSEYDTRVCPLCGMNMVKNYTDATQEIQVDDCYNCGGKFLDNKELDKIRAQYTTEADRVEAVMNEFKKAASEELEEFETKFNKQMKRPSLTTILLKHKYGNK